MTDTTTPLYQSNPTTKSLGNKYRIFSDRIELECNFPFYIKTLIIKKDDLVSIETFSPPVLRTSLWALKLDLADLNEHVGITRKSGIFKQLRFTPEDPGKFVQTVKQAFD